MAGKIAVEYYVQHHTGKLFIWNQCCGADIVETRLSERYTYCDSFRWSVKINCTEKHNLNRVWKNQPNYQHGEIEQQWQQ